MMIAEMALSPFFDFYRPRSIFDQHFGAAINPEDLMPFYSFGNYCRPWKSFTEETESTMCMDKDKFCICLDVKQFKPEEIIVKTMGRQIVIEGKHEERPDEHGYISRQFTRKYTIPEGFESDDVCSNLTADGILMIEAKKKMKSIGGERIVPINKIAVVCQKSGKKDTAQCIKENSKIDMRMKEEKGKMFEQNGKIKKEECMKMENCQMEKEDFKKTDSMKDDFKMKSAKEERCSLLNSDGTLKFSSDISSEALRAAKTSSIQERMDFTSSSMTSEMMQSKESSFTSTEMSCGIRSGDKADLISDIINAELKQAAENL